MTDKEIEWFNTAVTVYEEWVALSALESQRNGALLAIMRIVGDMGLSGEFAQALVARRIARNATRDCALGEGPEGQAVNS